MRQLTYLVEDFEAKNNAPKGFFCNASAIVDNELGNDISDDWDYQKGKIVVTGILHRDQIFMFIKDSEDDEDFGKEVCRKLLEIGCKVPLYAFNRNFEIGNFKGDFNCEIEIKEIKPFNARGWNKDRFYNELRKRNAIPNINLRDALNGDAKECPNKWGKYIKTNDFQHVMDIVSHNLSCLLKESVILKNKDYFWNNWKIDDNGFMVGEKMNKVYKQLNNDDWFIEVGAWAVILGIVSLAIIGIYLIK